MDIVFMMVGSFDVLPIFKLFNLLLIKFDKQNRKRR